MNQNNVLFLGLNLTRKKAMDYNILISTTNTLEGYHIEKYLGLVSTNTLIGPNFFQDLGPSLTDLIGGLPDTYQAKLQKIYTLTLDQLQLKGANKEANALVGLHMDFDEITSKGKSMFMVSAIATAVVVQKIARPDLTLQPAVLPHVTNRISHELLQQAMTKNSIIQKLKKKRTPSPEDWFYILTYRPEEIAEDLLGLYIHLHYNEVTEIFETNDKLKAIFAPLPSYFASIDKTKAIEVLYDKVESHKKIIETILIPAHVFSAQHIINLFQAGKISTAIKCLEIDSTSYSKTDLELMQLLVTLFEDMKDLGTMKEMKNHFGKPQLKYICPKGHVNPKETEYCQETEYDQNLLAGFCGLNIKGLKEREVKIIEKFKTKTAILAKMFEAQNK